MASRIFPNGCPSRRTRMNVPSEVVLSTLNVIVIRCSSRAQLETRRTVPPPPPRPTSRTLMSPDYLVRARGERLRDREAEGSARQLGLLRALVRTTQPLELLGIEVHAE